MCLVSKTKYLVRIFALFILCTLGVFYLLGYFNVASADSFGGGGSRGGGTGRKYTGGTIQRVLSQGYVGYLKEPVLRGDTSIANYACFAYYDNSTHGTARSLGVSTVYISPNTSSEYFVIFMNDSNKLVTTPWFKGNQLVEVPADSNYFIVYSKKSKTISFSFNHVAKTESEAKEKEKSNDGSVSFFAYDNLWLVGFGSEISSTGGRFINDSSYTCSSYFYQMSSDSSSLVVNVGDVSLPSDNLNFYVTYYDIYGKFIERTSFTSSSNYSTVVPHIATGNGKYLIRVSIGSSQGLKLRDGGISLSGFGSPISGAYACDYTSIEYIDNSVTIIGNSGNIVIGDGSSITVPDGGLTGGANTDKLPIERPPVDGGSDGDSDGDGSSSGIWDKIFESIGKIFGGLGKILSGLLSIILMPFEILIDLIATLVNSISGVISDITGVTDYFGTLFGAFPSWVTAPLSMAFTLMVVVALVKFIRG